MKLLFGGTAAALLLGIAASSSADAATARCGMTIRGKVKLTQDLNCVGQRPPTLVGPRAHLDLNGNTIFCGPPTASINLRGQGALIRNSSLIGGLDDCTVQLLDRGGVRNLRVSTLEPSALIIRSDSNEVVFSEFYNNNLGPITNPAVHVRSGRYNLISDNFISNDQTALLIEGHRTVVVSNQISVLEPGHDGIRVSGNFTRVMGNELVSSCIVVDAGTIENEVLANEHTSGGDTPVVCE
jgi:hypothetical protein